MIIQKEDKIRKILYVIESNFSKEDMSDDFVNMIKKIFKSLELDIAKNVEYDEVYFCSNEFLKDENSAKKIKIF